MLIDPSEIMPYLPFISLYFIISLILMETETRYGFPLALTRALINLRIQDDDIRKQEY
ncbi:hypothetical protein MCHI_002299 [Candidatus Magnetoovum chiemensis]|nr:hypothetical protein MCHI_002299 [Candidatus Magnetoovum chiemensis]